MPKTNDSGIILTDKVIVVPDKVVVVVRSDAEVAAAIMAAGPDFGKIHKGAASDIFKPFQNRR